MYLDNKYTRTYFALINKAKSRNFKSRKEAKTALGYVERHHIIPKSIGGTDSKSNLVYLTAREHFICHWLLIKMTLDKDKDKMIYAIFRMKSKSKNHKGRSSVIHSRVFEIHKLKHSEIISNMNNDRVKNGIHPFSGGEVQRKRVENGTHNFLGGEESRKSNKERLDLGIHNFLHQKGVNHHTYDSTKYNFINITTGERVYMTRIELANKYDLIQTNLGKMIRGLRKTCGGWKIN